MKKKILVALVFVLVAVFLGQLAMVTNSSNAVAADKGGGKVWCCFIDCSYPDPNPCKRHCLYVPPDECGALETMH